MGHHGRDHRKNSRGPFRIIFSQIVNSGRTGTGKIDARLRLFQQFSGLRTDQLRAEGGFTHSRESQFFQSSCEFRNPHPFEIADVTGRNRRINFRSGLQQVFGSGKVGADFFRMGGTNLDTFSAADAEFGNHRCPRVDDLNRLAMTVTDTFVTVLTGIGCRVDRKVLIHEKRPVV